MNDEASLFHLLLQSYSLECQALTELTQSKYMRSSHSLIDLWRMFELLRKPNSKQITSVETHLFATLTSMLATSPIVLHIWKHLVFQMDRSTKLLFPSANRSSISTKIKRRISFGTNNRSSQGRAFLFTYPAMVTMGFCLIFGGDIQRCHRSLDRTKSLNITTSKSSSQCSVSSNGSQLSYANCTTRLELHMLRILPLISYVSQLFAIRELFTLGVDYNRALIRVAWALSSCALFAIGIGMFSNNCNFFDYTIISLFSTGGVLGLLTAHDYVLTQIAADNAIPLVRSIRNHVRRRQEIVWFNENYIVTNQDLFFWSRRASFICSFFYRWHVYISLFLRVMFANKVYC